MPRYNVSDVKTSAPKLTRFTFDPKKSDAVYRFAPSLILDEKTGVYKMPLWGGWVHWVQNKPYICLGNPDETNGYQDRDNCPFCAVASRKGKEDNAPEPLVAMARNETKTIMFQYNVVNNKIMDFTPFLVNLSRSKIFDLRKAITATQGGLSEDDQDTIDHSTFDITITPKGTTKDFTIAVVSNPFHTQTKYHVVKFGVEDIVNATTKLIESFGGDEAIDRYMDNALGRAVSVAEAKDIVNRLQKPADYVPTSTTPTEVPENLDALFDNGF